MNANEIFHEAFHGNPNFMTPNLVSRRKVHPRLAVEISTGSPFMGGGPMVGVTVVRVERGGGVSSRHTLSRSGFESIADAESYCDRLESLCGGSQ